MTATTAPISLSLDSAVETTTSRPSLGRAGVAAGSVAAAATVAVVAVARLIDVPVQTEPGKAIPILGFAQLTLFFTAVGVLVARTIRNRSVRPHRTFVVTTSVLTALSLVPDLMLSTDTASKLTLMLTHLVAAAIVVPVLARRVES
ncbi:MAG: hypothetical protein JOZ37_09640 [Actinobacteria bacterium]|nr:hypothetical protein [Actinomycetota bacterium]MBV9253303.1 hypothetical protein [Actinomycetota bacterium]MBV9664218.1 hypothetical protein [Actinomycetota bacterium]MBV9936808.1 hypothetical protein [Actinomycetota bacterium]